PAPVDGTPGERSRVSGPIRNTIGQFMRIRPPGWHWHVGACAGKVLTAYPRRHVPACRPVLAAESRLMALPRSCPAFRRTLPHPPRRSFVKAGVLGSLGLNLADLFRAEARASTTTRQPAVIILWMRGGPSHIDMWDMKPDAPAEFRGEFGNIPT